MTFKHFVKELNGSRVEGELIKTAFYSLLTSLATLVLFYFFALRDIPDFIDKFGLYLLLSAVAYAGLMPGIRQVRAYCELPCMSGMMVGMTLGMIAGFLPGYYIGATNGMFIGSVFGMAFGISKGIWSGRCCGIMGIMEGMMAGFMGGLMGAMTAVMLFNDHARLMAVIVLVVSLIILVGLNYMVYHEMKAAERRKTEDYLLTAIISFVLMAITLWVMAFGPRSGLVA